MHSSSMGCAALLVLAAFSSYFSFPTPVIRMEILGVGVFPSLLLPDVVSSSTTFSHDVVSVDAIIRDASFSFLMLVCCLKGLAFCGGCFVMV